MASPITEEERVKDELNKSVTSILSKNAVTILSLYQIPKQTSSLDDIEKLDKPFVGAGAELNSDATATTILQRLDKNEKLEDAQIAWVLKRLYFLYKYMGGGRRVDGLMLTFIKFMASMPVLLSAPVEGKPSPMAFGSVFFGGETAREFSQGQITSTTIGNDEETLLSVIGLHHSILKTLKNMRRDDPDRLWVEHVLTEMFVTNKGMKTQLTALHAAMAKTDAIRGNSIFMYLGAFVRSYDDVSVEYSDTLIAYQTCIQDVYVLWTGRD